MFSEYNLSNFPEVEVVFGKTIKDDADFDKFITNWKDLYHRKTDFFFLMDTSKTGLVSIKYCYEMTKFIKHVKKTDPKFLKYSIILVCNQIVMSLLKFIFMMSKPLAPVYLVKTREDYIKLNDILKDNRIPTDIYYTYVKSYLE